MIVPFDTLCTQIAAMFRSVGMTQKNAAQMAEILVTAEARGVYSHGIQLVPEYLRHIEDGIASANPKIKILQESDSTLLVDGDNGFGGISLTAAVDLAIEKSRKTGSCALSMVNCNHYGAGAYYVERAAARNQLSYLYANTPKMAAPFGGSERYFGTNPYSFCAPAGKYGNIVLDMATTETAAGKLRAAIDDGVQVRLGFGVDRNGKPTTDPAEILHHGALSHFGGVKGYGIAFMIQVATGVFSGAAYKANDVGMMRMISDRPTVSFFMNLIDIASFMEPKQFSERTERLISEIKQVRTAGVFNEVCYPGEIENRRLAQALQSGVNIHDAAYTAFCEDAHRRGVEL